MSTISECDLHDVGMSAFRRIQARAIRQSNAAVLRERAAHLVENRATSATTATGVEAADATSGRMTGMGSLMEAPQAQGQRVAQATTLVQTGGYMELRRALRAVNAAIAQTLAGDPARRALESTRTQLVTEMGRRHRRYGIGVGGGLLALYVAGRLWGGRR